MSVRFKNPLYTVGASFRFFASKGTMFPMFLNTERTASEIQQGLQSKRRVRFPILYC